MQIKTESISNTQQRLNIEVSTSGLKDEVEKKLRKIAKTAKIDGFRPGKVPLSHIRSQYGMGVQQEAINDLINNSVFEAIDKENIRIISAPQIDDVKLEEETISYSATVEIFPNVEVTGLDAIELVRKTASVNDEDVDTMIESLRKQRQTFAEKEGEVVNGDQATFDFEGSIDGENFEGGTATDFTLVVGSNRMIPGFEDGLVGMKVGEEKVIDVTFPEDYQAEDLKGKEAQFKLNVKKIEEAVLPEIDEEFLALFSITEGGEEKLKEEVKKNMEREIKNAARTQIKSVAFDALVEKNDIEVPQTLIDNEIERKRNAMIQRFAQQFGGNAGGLDQSIFPDEMFTEQATKSAKLSVLVSSLIESNDIAVDETKVQAYIAEMAENYEDPQEVVDYYTNDKEQKAQIDSVVLEDQVVEFILDKAKVSDETVSYQDLLANAQAINQM